MKAICVAWIILDVVFAYFVAKWTRGILPVIALAIVIFLMGPLRPHPNFLTQNSKTDIVT